LEKLGADDADRTKCHVAARSGQMKMKFAERSQEHQRNQRTGRNDTPAPGNRGRELQNEPKNPNGINSKVLYHLHSRQISGELPRIGSDPAKIRWASDQLAESMK